MRAYYTSPACWGLFLGALLITLALTPVIIRFSRRVKTLDRSRNGQDTGRNIPLMGGLAIIIPILGTCLFGILQPTQMFHLLGAYYKELALLGAGGVIIAILGVIDDVRGLGAKEKFSGQILVGLLVCMAGKGLVLVNLPVVGTINLGILGGWLVTLLWIVGLINAFNLVDGVDGLATGLALISSIGLGIVAALNGQTMVVLVCLALSGSLIGFLVYNYHPARIFLGDTGSMFLGFVLATLALLGSSRASGSVMLLTPMLALGFPIFDAVTSMLRRILRGRNPFVGDRSHTHHRLLESGYTQPQVVLILVSVSVMCTIAAVLCQIFYPREHAPLFAIGLYALVIMFVAWMNGYLRLRQAWRVARCRSRNNKLDKFGRFASLSLNADASLANLQEILRVGCKEMNLCFLNLSILREGEEDSESILSVEARGDNVAKELADPVESLRVCDRGGLQLFVRYQVNHSFRIAPGDNVDARETDKLEHQDIMACLAHLFGRIDMNRMLEESAVTNPALLSKSAVVRDIIDRN